MQHFEVICAVPSGQIECLAQSGSYFLLFFFCRLLPFGSEP